MGQSRRIDDDKMWRKRTSYFPCPRVHCPEERSKAKEVENYQYTSAQLFLLISSVSTEQSQILCEEYKACHVRTVRLVVAEQSDPLFEPACLLMRIPTPSTDDFCARRSIAKVPRTIGRAITTKSCDQDLYWCRIPDNGWHRTILHDKTHWRVLTIYRTSDMSWVHFAKRWWINWPERLDSREHQKWNTKSGPVLEVTTSYLQGKHGVEIRIESVNKDNSHSSVRISHGLNKLVTDLIEKEDDNNEQETSEMQFEDFALKTNVLSVASRSKAKANPRRRTPALLIYKNCTYQWKILDWYWARKLFVYPSPIKTIEYSSSSMVNCFEKKMEWLNSGE